MKKSKIRRQLISTLILYGFVKENIEPREHIALHSPDLHLTILIHEHKGASALDSLYSCDKLSVKIIVNDLRLEIKTLAINKNTINNVLKIITI